MVFYDSTATTAIDRLNLRKGRNARTKGLVMEKVRWLNGLGKSLPRAVRESWKAYVFWPGDRVRLDYQSGLIPSDVARRMSGRSTHVPDRLLTVTETLVSESEPGKRLILRAHYRLAGSTGLWPHAWLIEPQPLRLVHGAIIAAPAGGSTQKWLMPLSLLSSHLPDPVPEPIRLDPVLGRRAQYALKMERVSQLCPMTGEFLIALRSETAGSLYAILWHSPMRETDKPLLTPIPRAGFRGSPDRADRVSAEHNQNP